MVAHLALLGAPLELLTGRRLRATEAAMEHDETGFGHIYNFLLPGVFVCESCRCCVCQNAACLTTPSCFLLITLFSAVIVRRRDLRSYYVTVVGMGYRWTAFDDACGAGTMNHADAGGR